MEASVAINEETVCEAATGVEQVDDLLRLILSFLPPRDAFRLIGVCKRWDSLLLEEIRAGDQFVSASALAFLCRRVGDGPKLLDVSTPACAVLTAADVLAALQPQPSALPRALRTFVAWRAPPPGDSDAAPARSLLFSSREVEQLRVACPRLLHASLRVRAEWYSFRGATLRRLGTVPGTLHLAHDGLSIGSKMGDESAKELPEDLSACPSITSLDLSDNELHRAGLEAVMSLVTTTGSPLLALNLSANCFNNDDGGLIAAALADSACRLTSLDLSYNNLGSAGSKEIALALRGNASLRLLRLDSNRVDDSAALTIARALEGNSTLLTLGLGSNSITCEGAKALAQALLGPSAAAGSQNAAAAGGADLSTAATAAPSPSAAAAEQTGRRSCPAIRSLLLMSNRIGFEGCKALQAAAHSNTAALSIDLRFNPGF